MRKNRQVAKQNTFTEFLIYAKRQGKGRKNNQIAKQDAFAVFLPCATPNGKVHKVRAWWMKTK